MKDKVLFCTKPKSLSLSHLGPIKCCNECPYKFLGGWSWACSITKKCLGLDRDLEKGIPGFCPLKNEDEVNVFKG